MQKAIISVCLCTANRPLLLLKCLESLLAQNESPTFEIIVTDNVPDKSAQNIVESFHDKADLKGISLVYVCEPQKGISYARNTCLDHATGEYVAFIDDDECACPQWLSQLYKTLLEENTDGVWGAVKPVFDKQFPVWQQKLFIRDRSLKDRHVLLSGDTLRTGNALVKKKLLLSRTPVFDPALALIGGEDSDLFKWLLLNKQPKFVWRADAVVYEFQPIERSTLKWHLRRSYRGGWGYTDQLLRRHSTTYSWGIILVRTLPILLYRCMTSLSAGNPRAILLNIARQFSAQAGKISRLLNITAYEYRNNNRIN